MKKHFVYLVGDRRGATAVEYALIGTLIALGVGVALTGVMGMLRTMVDAIQMVLASP